MMRLVLLADSPGHVLRVRVGGGVTNEERSFAGAGMKKIHLVVPFGFSFLGGVTTCFAKEISVRVNFHTKVYRREKVLNDLPFSSVGFWTLSISWWRCIPLISPSPTRWGAWLSSFPPCLSLEALHHCWRVLGGRWWVRRETLCKWGRLQEVPRRERPSWMRVLSTSTSVHPQPPKREAQNSDK